MERKYTILAFLLIMLALELVILPKKSEPKETDPELLLSSVVGKSRYLPVDLVTHRIIENDPSLLLVDLRTPEQFKSFSLPGSVNIQPDSLFSKNATELLSQPGKDKVLISNSDLLSEKAWLICTRYSIPRMYVMKGGLNEWFNTFIKEKAVSNTASSGELDIADFREAAHIFFTGTGEKTASPDKTEIKEKIRVIRRTPAAASGGGC